MRVYLDAPPVIYVVENREPYAERVRTRFRETETELIVSDLTRLECRVKPVRDGGTDLLRDFDRFFETAVREVVALSREVLDVATEIRARYGFRTARCHPPRGRRDRSLRRLVHQRPSSGPL